MIVIVKKYGIWNGSCTMSVKNAFLYVLKRSTKASFFPHRSSEGPLLGFIFGEGDILTILTKKLVWLGSSLQVSPLPKDLVVFLDSVVEKFFHCLTKSHFQTKCSLTHQSFKFHWISQSMIAVTVDFTAWHPPPCD